MSPSEQTPYIWFGPPHRSFGPFKQTSPPQWFGPDPYWHGSVGTSNGSHGGTWKGEHWYVKFKKMNKDLKFMIGKRAVWNWTLFLLELESHIYDKVAYMEGLSFGETMSIPIQW